MSLPAPYLRNVIAFIRVDEDGRETRLIKPANGQVEAIMFNQTPQDTRTISLEPVRTVWGTYTMYVVRDKDHD